MIWQFAFLIFAIVAAMGAYGWWLAVRFDEREEALQKQIINLHNETGFEIDKLERGFEKFKKDDAQATLNGVAAIDDVRKDLEETKKRLCTAEFLTHSLKVDVARPRKVHVTLEKVPKVKAAKPEKKTLLGRAGITKPGARA